jgi:cytochrome c oxidase subunit 4
MPERTISVTTYVLVCVLLVLLTFLTVGVSFIPFREGIWHFVIGLCIGAVKASLVVLFFMHVIISPRLTWAVILIVCAWVGILFILTLTDYATRDVIPHMPGH